MNAIDRAIAAVSPVWGAKRAAARRAIRVMSNSEQRYVGKPGDWDRNTGNPDDARPARFVDRKRVLDLVAQDPFARKALATLVNNTVGWGITGAPKKAPATFRKLWNDWLKICDWYGRLGFYAIQELAVRTMFREGESFIVLQPLSTAEANGSVPLRLQLLDAAMLATNLTSHLGNEVIEGIEYDNRARVVAYHFFKHRPGLRGFSFSSVRIPAEDVIHLFVQEYIGQRRGISVFNTVVKRLGDIDESVEAELVRKNIEACFAAFITQGVDENGVVFGALQGDAEASPIGVQTEGLSPGMISRLGPGENVKFGDPKASGGLTDILRLALLSSAAGTGITYEHFGDLSNVNFSSYKAGNLEFERSTGRIQFNTIIPVFLERVAARFQDAAFLAGLMPNRTYELGWSPPPFESIDRKGDAEADILEMAAGLESRPNLVIARGYDPDQLRTDIAVDRDANKAAGLVFAGDAPPTQFAAPAEQAAAA